MSRTKLIIIGSLVALVFLVLAVYLVLGGLSNTTTTERADLQFWGVFDDAGFYSDLIRAYEKANPNVRINYRPFTFENYERELLDAFASGRGPDIWLIHNTWLPKHGDKIQPLPQQKQKGQDNPLFTLKNFRDQFVDVAATDLVFGTDIYALPIYVDTLALYYNKDIFDTVGIASPPKDWEEFNDVIRQVTQFNQQNEISRAGAAVGTVRNINRSTDILMLMMMQSGTEMTDTDNAGAAFAQTVGGQRVGETALQYYTDFANPLKQTYTWNDEQHYSIDAFVEGSVAMMLNYSHHTETIRAKSPRFNFTVASVPQPTGAERSVNFANYWAPTVSKQSLNGFEAWRFLVYLSSAEGATTYLNTSGRPAARRDLIALQQEESEIGVFAKQALSAHSWFQVDNLEIETIFAEMIEDVNFGRASIRDALRSAESRVSVLMQRNVR